MSQAPPEYQDKPSAIGQQVGGKTITGVVTPTGGGSATYYSGTTPVARDVPAQYGATFAPPSPGKTIAATYGVPGTTVVNVSGQGPQFASPQYRSAEVPLRSIAEYGTPPPAESTTVQAQGATVPGVVRGGVFYPVFPVGAGTVDVMRLAPFYAKGEVTTTTGQVFKLGQPTFEKPNVIREAPKEVTLFGIPLGSKEGGYVRLPYPSLVQAEGKPAQQLLQAIFSPQGWEWRSQMATSKEVPTAALGFGTGLVGGIGLTALGVPAGPLLIGSTLAGPAVETLFTGKATSPLPVQLYGVAPTASQLTATYSMGAGGLVGAGAVQAYRMATAPKPVVENVPLFREAYVRQEGTLPSPSGQKAGVVDIFVAGATDKEVAAASVFSKELGIRYVGPKPEVTVETTGVWASKPITQIGGDLAMAFQRAGRETGFTPSAPKDSIYLKFMEVGGKGIEARGQAAIFATGKDLPSIPEGSSLIASTFDVLEPGKLTTQRGAGIFVKKAVAPEPPIEISSRPYSLTTKVIGGELTTTGTKTIVENFVPSETYLFEGIPTGMKFRGILSEGSILSGVKSSRQYVPPTFQTGPKPGTTGLIPMEPTVGPSVPTVAAPSGAAPSGTMEVLLTKQSLGAIGGVIGEKLISPTIQVSTVGTRPTMGMTMSLPPSFAPRQSSAYPAQLVFPSIDRKTGILPGEKGKASVFLGEDFLPASKTKPTMAQLEAPERNTRTSMIPGFDQDRTPASIITPDVGLPPSPPGGTSWILPPAPTITPPTWQWQAPYMPQFEGGFRQGYRGREPKKEYTPTITGILEGGFAKKGQVSAIMKHGTTGVEIRYPQKGTGVESKKNMLSRMSVWS